jgi:alpha-tubulin suppressor-like RCC1 family protein
VRADGTVVAWGASTSGQLAVPAGLDRVTGIACSGFATIAIRDDGTVVAWGGGTNPANGPSPASEWATGVSKVVAKGSIALAVRRPAADGTPGDLDGDGQVNAADLAILLGAWGSAGPGDLDGDGQVNAADLAILLGLWS